MAGKRKRRKPNGKAKSTQSGDGFVFQSDFIDILFGNQSGDNYYPIVPKQTPLFPPSGLRLPPLGDFFGFPFSPKMPIANIPGFNFGSGKSSQYSEQEVLGPDLSPQTWWQKTRRNKGTAGETIDIDDEKDKADGERKKQLEKILRLLNLLTKGRIGFYNDILKAVSGKGLEDIFSTSALSKFAPAVAAFIGGVQLFKKMLDGASNDRKERAAVEQRAAGLGFKAEKAYSADVMMKAFGGNFESIAKPMTKWAEAMTGVKMGDSGQFSDIMKQVATLKGMGYNIDLRHGSGQFGMASNEEFFVRLADALKQSIQKGDIGAQQKIQSLAGFDSSIADMFTSIKGTTGRGILNYAFSQEGSSWATARTANRQGRRELDTGFGIIGNFFKAVASRFWDELSNVKPGGGSIDHSQDLKNLRENFLPKKAHGGRETRPAIFAEAGPEWFIPEKNDENSRALLIQAAEACGFDMFAGGGRNFLHTKGDKWKHGFKGPNRDWKRRRTLDLSERTAAELSGFKGPNHDWKLRRRSLDGGSRTTAEQMGFKGPSPVNHNNSVVMNISNVEVSANDSQEFIASMLKVKKSPLSNVAKSVASSMDSKRIA